jgi:murein L,D-transpeptidase YafK
MKYLTLVVVLFLAACNHTVPDQPRDSSRAAAVQSQWMRTRNAAVGVTNDAPVLIRIFKQESELELWKQRGDHFVKVATFDICKFSGVLGPKKREGDRQAPEGFYEITASQLNPHSQEWLSVNTGFPNAYDRSKGYSGSSLMIHGGCSSIGCYAIKDGPMQDLYASLRDAFKSGQRTVQLQIYPYKMTFAPSGEHAEFWSQLKVGYDKFNQTNQQLNVKIEKGKYIID